jgi:hypothetical protein
VVQLSNGQLLMSLRHRHKRRQKEKEKIWDTLKDDKLGQKSNSSDDWAEFINGKGVSVDYSKGFKR